MRVLAYSQAPCGAKLITFEFETYRYILAEINTHKALSRNYQSSRAVPLKKQRRAILKRGAEPIMWGSNNPGMQSNAMLLGWRKRLASAIWISAKYSAAFHHFLLEKVGLHKQWTNRIIEPYMFTKGIITCNTDKLEDIFKLRIHKDAQPEFNDFALHMRNAMKKANIQYLRKGELHLPYIKCYRDINTNEIKYSAPNIKEFKSETDAITYSVASIAQVSYMISDMTMEKAEKILDRLNILSKTTPHLSPTEHIAYASDSEISSGNLTGFTQYRKIIEETIV